MFLPPLKIAIPTILLRNINSTLLDNDTRLSVRKMVNNIMEITILTGKLKREDVLLPRIQMKSTDMSFDLKGL